MPASGNSVIRPQGVRGQMERGFRQSASTPHSLVPSLRVASTVLPACDSSDRKASRYFSEEITA